MGFIASFVERRIRFNIYNVSISAHECFKLYVKMPSDLKFNLANTLSGLKAFAIAFHPLRGNCPKSMNKH